MNFDWKETMRTGVLTPMEEEPLRISEYLLQIRIEDRKKEIRFKAEGDDDALLRVYAFLNEQYNDFDRMLPYSYSIYKKLSIARICELIENAFNKNEDVKSIRLSNLSRYCKELLRLPLREPLSEKREDEVLEDWTRAEKEKKADSKHLISQTGGKIRHFYGGVHFPEDYAWEVAELDDHYEVYASNGGTFDPVDYGILIGIVPFDEFHSNRGYEVNAYCLKKFWNSSELDEEFQQGLKDHYNDLYRYDVDFEEIR